MSDNKSNSTKTVVPYPISPVVIEKKLLGQDIDINASSSVGQTEILTFVEEGNGVFSLEQENGSRSKENSTTICCTC